MFRKNLLSEDPSAGLDPQFTEVSLMQCKGRIITCRVPGVGTAVAVSGEKNCETGIFSLKLLQFSFRIVAAGKYFIETSGPSAEKMKFGRALGDPLCVDIKSIVQQPVNQTGTEVHDCKAGKKKSSA
jgi:hypothetical protein